MFSDKFKSCVHHVYSHVFQHVYTPIKSMFTDIFEHACEKKCLYGFILFEDMKKQYLKNIYEEMFALLMMICSHVYYSFKEKEIRGKASTSLQFLLKPTNSMKRIEASQCDLENTLTEFSIIYI